MKEEKNRNITPFVQLSPRLNQHSIRRDLSERKRYLRKYVLPIQQKASQSDNHPPQGRGRLEWGWKESVFHPRERRERID